MSGTIDHDGEMSVDPAVPQQLLRTVLTQHHALLRELLQERCRARRHKNVRFAVVVCGILLVVAMYLYLFGVLGGSVAGAAPSSPYAAVVQIKGEIADDKPANAVAVNKALTRAFKDPRARGVVLYINSAGGSPVQSAIIHDRILALKAEHPDKPIVAVATDVVASGAYFVASAADSIYVNRSTITGSIGVISAGFGFPDALERFGVERRVFTAGQAKAQLDPFTPLSDGDTDKINRILSEIHQHFITSVTAARGDRLALETAGLFDGDVWTGAEAVEIGLVDGLGDLTTVLQREWGIESTRDYTIKPALLDRLMRFAANTAVDELVAHNRLNIR